MSNNNDDSNILPTAILIGTLLLGVVFWRLSQNLHLEFWLTVREVLGTTLIIVLYGVYLFFTRKDDWKTEIFTVSFWNMLPLVLAIIWVAWWPALNYWSEHASDVSNAAIQSSSSSMSFSLRDDMDEVQWYARWYSMGGGILILLSPYLYACFKRD